MATGYLRVTSACGQLGHRPNPHLASATPLMLACMLHFGVLVVRFPLNSANKRYPQKTTQPYMFVTMSRASAKLVRWQRKGHDVGLDHYAMPGDVTKLRRDRDQRHNCPRPFIDLRPCATGCSARNAGKTPTICTHAQVCLPPLTQHVQHVAGQPTAHFGKLESSHLPMLGLDTLKQKGHHGSTESNKLEDHFMASELTDPKIKQAHHVGLLLGDPILILSFGVVVEVLGRFMFCMLSGLRFGSSYCRWDPGIQ